MHVYRGSKSQNIFIIIIIHVLEVSVDLHTYQNASLHYYNSNSYIFLLYFSTFHWVYISLFIENLHDVFCKPQASLVNLQKILERNEEFRCSRVCSNSISRGKSGQYNVVPGYELVCRSMQPRSDHWACLEYRERRRRPEKERSCICTLDIHLGYTPSQNTDY